MTIRNVSEVLVSEAVIENEITNGEIPMEEAAPAPGPLDFFGRSPVVGGRVLFTIGQQFHLGTVLECGTDHILLWSTTAKRNPIKRKSDEFLIKRCV